VLLIALRLSLGSQQQRLQQDTQFNILNDNLVGPTILGFSTSEDDMGAAARLLSFLLVRKVCNYANVSTLINFAVKCSSF
jgi:hypothetical protein